MAVAAEASGENLELGSPSPVAGDILAKTYDLPYESDLDYAPLSDGGNFIVVAEAEARGFTVIANLGRLLRDRARVAVPRP